LSLHRTHSESLSAPADERLVARILLGDDEALAEVRRWVRGAVSPYRFKLAAEIEDLEQEVLLELLEALRAGRFEGRSLLATYVRRMVHHKSLNRLRARRGRQWVDCDAVELVDPEPTPFDLSRRRGDLELGLRVLASMPESCRELWTMIHRGLGYEAMGERLGVAAGTLRVRVLRCREKALALRAEMAGGGNATPAAVT
jgi:RNA polymerase sigma factor (sigma-70 family)